jgi:Lar family restriction alleviation protein
MKIKACPFCGATESLEATPYYIGEICPEEFDSDDVAVCCNINKKGCGATGGYRETKEEAIKAWNKRAPYIIMEVINGKTKRQQE